MKNLFLFCILILSGSLTAQQADLSGTIQTLSGDPLIGVEVELRNDQDSLVATTQTDGNGQYSLAGLPGGAQGYRLKLRKILPHLQDLSTFDLVLISRHILAILPFNSPAQHLAADINGSETITTYDMVLLRRLILNIDTDVPGGPIHGHLRFFPTGWTPPNPNNPLPDLDLDFPVQLAAGANTYDFTGVKLGNVN